MSETGMPFGLRNSTLTTLGRIHSVSFEISDTSGFASAIKIVPCWSVALGGI